MHHVVHHVMHAHLRASRRAASFVRADVVKLVDPKVGGVLGALRNGQCLVVRAVVGDEGLVVLGGGPQHGAWGGGETGSTTAGMARRCRSPSSTKLAGAMWTSTLPQNRSARFRLWC